MLNQTQKISLASKLPIGQYRIDVLDGSYLYNTIDTETGLVDFSRAWPAACGCCTEYDYDQIMFSELSLDIQEEILVDLYDRYRQ